MLQLLLLLLGLELLAAALLLAADLLHRLALALAGLPAATFSATRRARPLVGHAPCHQGRVSQAD